MKEYNYHLKSSHNINIMDKELESQLYWQTIKKKKKDEKQHRMMNPMMEALMIKKKTSEIIAQFHNIVYSS